MKKNTTYLVALCLIALVAIVVLSKNNWNLNFLNPANNGGTPSPSPSPSPSQGGNNYYYDNSQPQPANNRQPTSLTCSISPNPITMTWWMDGSVTSNGYNWPITIYAKLKGTGEQQSFEAFLGSDGKYTQAQQLNTAGYWDFWATTAEGVTSNTVSLTCEGILVSPSSNHYSRLVAHPITFKIYSNFNGNAQLTATSPTGTVYTLATVSVSHSGYGEVTMNLGSSVLPTIGNYHIDVSLAGHTASGYSGDCYVEIMR